MMNQMAPSTATGTWKISAYLLVLTSVQERTPLMSQISPSLAGEEWV